MTTEYAKGTIKLKNIITKTDWDGYSIFFDGEDCFTHEEIKGYMNTWDNPIPIYKPNEDTPLNPNDYEGLEVKGLVAYTTRYSAKGKLCYNIEGVQIDDSISVKKRNPFSKINPFMLHDAICEQDDEEEYESGSEFDDQGRPIYLSEDGQKVVFDDDLESLVPVSTD